MSSDSDRRFLTPTDKDNLFTIDHFPLWYRLAVENSPGSFFYYSVIDKGPSPHPSAFMSCFRPADSAGPSLRRSDLHRGHHGGDGDV